MTKEEAIKRAKEFGYIDENIEEMIGMVEEANKNGVPVTFDYIAENVLSEQPVY